MAEQPHERLDGPVHEWFELSYSNYQVLHRTLMQSMPLGWQRRMVACLSELRAAFRHIEQAPGYEVTPCDWLAPVEMGEADMRAAGVTVEWPYGADAEPLYQDREGNELDANIGRVAVPRGEPVPHYDRGRTYILPATPDAVTGQGCTLHHRPDGSMWARVWCPRCDAGDASDAVTTQPPTDDDRAALAAQQADDADAQERAESEPDPYDVAAAEVEAWADQLRSEQHDEPDAATTEETSHG